MHGFLEILVLLVFVASGTGLLLAGVVAGVVAADRRTADRRAAGERSTPADERADGPAGGRAAPLIAEARNERRTEQAARR
jgi:hypothetical protein